MFKSIKAKLISNRIIVSNFGYLSILQIVSLFLPLATYPYLIRVLGTSIYGQIIFAQALMAYFSILINYGFNISATKDVAISREIKSALSEILSSVILLKLLIWLLSFIILVSLVCLLPPFKDNKVLYLLSFGVCFNELLFQQFFFQGIEKMRYITFINLASRLLFFALIFIFIKSPSDYLLVPLLNGIGAALGGVVAFYIIVYVEKIELRLQPYSVLKRYFLASTPFFLSRFSTVVISKTNTLILGAFVGYQEVAYYDLAQKIQSVLLIPFDIFNQVIYPQVARSRNMAFMKKVLKGVTFIALVFFCLMLVFSQSIISILGGKDLLEASPIVLILTFSIIFISQNYFLGNTILVVMGQSKIFNASVIFTAVVYLISIGLLFIINNINIYSLAYVGLFSSLSCSIYRYFYSKKYKFL